MGTTQRMITHPHWLRGWQHWLMRFWSFCCKCKPVDSSRRNKIWVPLRKLFIPLASQAGYGAWFSAHLLSMVLNSFTALSYNLSQ